MNTDTINELFKEINTLRKKEHELNLRVGVLEGKLTKKRTFKSRFVKTVKKLTGNAAFASNNSLKSSQTLKNI